MPERRVDDFVGTDCDYIRYLERAVLLLRTQLTQDDQTNKATTRKAAPSHRSSSIHTDPPLAANQDDIHFVHFQPGEKRRRRSSPGWLTQAKCLVKETPAARDWDQTFRDKGLHAIMETGSALAYLLDTNVQQNVSTVGTLSVSKQSDVVSYVRHYAQAAAARSVAASVALTLANFQKFLVLSACAVLLEEDIPSVEILTVAKLCVGNVTDDYCNRIVRSTKAVNELIDMLNLRGWGYRSSELLLVWNRTPAFYFLLMSSSRAALGYLVEQLSQEAFYGHSMSDRPWTPIFIPSIVNHILGFRIPIARISQVLNYKNGHVLKIRRNIWKVAESSGVVDSADPESSSDLR